MRKALSAATKRDVLHEAGYKCGNAACRGIITLDIHHIEYFEEGGSDDPANLLPFCPNCHALHHAGKIPRESIRAWKMLLLSLNDGFSRAAVDLLLALDHLAANPLLVYNDTVLTMGSLIASGLVSIGHAGTPPPPRHPDATGHRYVSLSEKGKRFVTAWKAGKQDEAVGA